MAREIDTKAAAYIRDEELKREVEREKRDREFWMIMLGGKSSAEDDIVIEEVMSETRLGNR